MHLNAVEGKVERTEHNSYAKWMVNLEGQPQSWSCKDVKHFKQFEFKKHGGMHKIPIERLHHRNAKDLTMKQMFHTRLLGHQKVSL